MAISRWLIALLLITVGCTSSSERGEFPDFSLDNLRDREETLTFDDVAQDRPVVVNFFASWCGPCKRELPVFAEAFAEHGDEVAFLGVDTEDSASEAVEMLDRYGIEYPAVYDPDATVRSALGRSTGLPVTAFVDADGTVVKIVARELTAEELEDAIQELVEIGHKAAE